MLAKISAFIMSVIAFITSIFSFGFGISAKNIVYSNLAYGNGEREVLDLVIPKKAIGETNLILFIHGGAWIEGDKKTYRDTLTSVADNYGLCAAAINYTYISEKTDINNIMDEVTEALQTIKAKGKENGISINKVILTGSSAGAHLSLLYGYSRADKAPIKPVAVVSLCGPTDLSAVDDYLKSNIGSQEYICTLLSYACGCKFTVDTIDDAVPCLEKVSPISYVSSSTIPTVIAHGKKDMTVPFSQAEALDKKLTEAGVEHEFVAYPNSDHILSSDPDSNDEVYAFFYEYAMKYLK